MASFFSYGWGSTISGLLSHYEEAIYFSPLSSPKISWFSFDRPKKDERLSRPWSHPVGLNTGLLDWESYTLTTRPLLVYRKGKKVLIFGRDLISTRR